MSTQSGTHQRNSAVNVNDDVIVNVHEQTGYKYTKEEDAPGFLWKRKAAVRDAQHAFEQLTDKEDTIGAKYGDIGLEQAEARLKRGHP